EQADLKRRFAGSLPAFPASSGEGFLRFPQTRADPQSVAIMSPGPRPEVRPAELAAGGFRRAKLRCEDGQLVEMEHPLGILIAELVAAVEQNLHELRLGEPAVFS